LPVDISDFISSIDSAEVQDTPKASSEVPLIRPLFLKKTLKNEMGEIVEKLCDLMSRNKAVDKKLSLIQNEIKAEENSGIDVHALTREKEACQKVLVELAAKRKRIMKEHENDVVLREICDQHNSDQEFAFLNIPYWEETLLKSSKVPFIISKILILTNIKGNSRQITSSVFSTISSGASAVISTLQDLIVAQNDDKEDALILQITKLLKN